MGGGQVVGQLSLASSAPPPPPLLYLTMGVPVPMHGPSFPFFPCPKKSSPPPCFFYYNLTSGNGKRCPSHATKGGGRTNRWSLRYSPVEVGHFGSIAGRFRGIYGIYHKLMEKSRKMSTCDGLDLEMLGSWLVMPKDIDLTFTYYYCSQTSIAVLIWVSLH